MNIRVLVTAERLTSGLFFMFKSIIWKKSCGLATALEGLDEGTGEGSGIVAV
jgi:hypothetical protein